MKMYTLKFVIAFSEKVRDEQPQDLRRFIVKFEEEYYRELPDDFNIENLVSIICEVFGISEDEFHSHFKYGELGAARQVMCYILSLYNLKSREISEMTGYSQPRVINSILNIKQSMLSENHDSMRTTDRVNVITEKMGI